MKRWAILVLLALFLGGCGTDRHVAGIVTDTNTWTTVICQYKGGCTTYWHHSFVVSGHEYQDDVDDVRNGDYVSFTDNSFWGVSDLHDDTVHHDDFPWVWVVLGLVVLGGAGWIWYRRWNEVTA